MRKPMSLLRRQPRPDGRTGDVGMVTAEMAMALPVLVLLASLGALAIGVAQAKVRCADAAREAARAIARGDPSGARRLADAAAGRPVTMATISDDVDTAVTVHLRLHPVSWIAGVTVSETAVVATEPSTAP
jgi:Flp pilus assembly protein TadG